MSTNEFIDKNSGAIIFKEDDDTKMLKRLLRRVEELETRIKILEDRQKESR